MRDLHEGVSNNKNATRGGIKFIDSMLIKIVHFITFKLLIFIDYKMKKKRISLPENMLGLD